jgi:hypothetical protein
MARRPRPRSDRADFGVQTARMTRAPRATRTASGFTRRGPPVHYAWNHAALERVTNVLDDLTRLQRIRSAVPGEERLHFRGNRRSSNARSGSPARRRRAAQPACSLLHRREQHAAVSYRSPAARRRGSGAPVVGRAEPPVHEERLSAGGCPRTRPEEERAHLHLRADEEAARPERRAPASPR